MLFFCKMILQKTFWKQSQQKFKFSQNYHFGISNFGNFFFLTKLSDVEKHYLPKTFLLPFKSFAIRQNGRPKFCDFGKICRIDFWGTLGVASSKMSFRNFLILLLFCFFKKMTCCQKTKISGWSPFEQKKNRHQTFKLGSPFLKFAEKSTYQFLRKQSIYQHETEKKHKKAVYGGMEVLAPFLFWRKKKQNNLFPFATIYIVPLFCIHHLESNLGVKKGVKSWS